MFQVEEREELGLKSGRKVIFINCCLVKLLCCILFLNLVFFGYFNIPQKSRKNH